jgi:hypothetical protein
VASFHEELPKHWEIYDRTGVAHNFEYNGLANNPLLTTGWMNLRNQFSWPEFQKLSFFYYGENRFFMLIDSNSMSPIPSSFPPFHTLNHSTNTNPKFRIRLRNNHVNSTTMVRTPNQFIFYVFLFNIF